jgi:hypothetical protein
MVEIMMDDGSLKIRREYAGGDVQFTFPVRPLAGIKVIGIILIGFGLMFAWVPLHRFSLFELPFVIAGGIPAAIGLLMLFGRCRVGWKDGQLRAAEMLGPLRWTRRLPRQPIRKLEVGVGSSRTGTAPAQPIEGFCALVAVFEDGSKKLVALGYPKDWLLAVAGELKGYVGGSAFSGISTQVEVVEQKLANESDADVLEQPAGSLVQVEEHTNGVKLAVPPAGLRRGSMGLFFFGLLWCSFMAVFTTVAVLPGSKTEGPTWVIILFMLGFWAIGLGLLAAAINLGRRTATLTADGGRLRLETKGLFGAKQVEWSHGEIAAIRADASNIEVNHRRLLELQIHPATGKKVGLLTGRDDQELRWLATRLRRALNVPARKPEA